MIGKRSGVNFGAKLVLFFGKNKRLLFFVIFFDVFFCYFQLFFVILQPNLKNHKKRR